MTLDELLLEWSYRSERGYPSTDNPSDVLLLKEILRELKLPEAEIDGLVNDLEGEDDDIEIKVNPGDEENTDEDETSKTVKKPKLEPEPKSGQDTELEGLNSYDLTIKKGLEREGLWEGSMPIPQGEYKWPGEGGGTFDEKVDPQDIKLWDVIFPLSPPKKGDPDSASKGVGNGELSLYWLYKYGTGVDVTEGREGDNPDLEFDGVGVEVKAKDSHGGKQGLGRFGQDTQQIKLLGMIFGLNALIAGFKEKDPSKKWAPKEANPLTWNGKDLINAFQIVMDFKNVDISQIADIPGFGIFKDIEANLKWMDDNLGEYSDAEEGARKMAKSFVLPKLGRKPRDGGYLVNLRLPKGHDMRFFNIDLDKIVTREDAINHISTSQGDMKINYQKVFGNN